MFLNILRTSASNVLKTFLNIILSYWVYIGYFQLARTNRKHKYALLTSCYQLINKIDLGAKLYMHNTTGDVALTNISQETKHLHDFECAVLKKKVPRLSSSSECSDLNFWQF